MKQIDEPPRNIVRCDCEHGSDEDRPTSGPNEGGDRRGERTNGNEKALLLLWRRVEDTAANFDRFLDVVISVRTLWFDL